MHFIHVRLGTKSKDFFVTLIAKMILLDNLLIASQNVLMGGVMTGFNATNRIITFVQATVPKLSACQKSKKHVSNTELDGYQNVEKDLCHITMEFVTLDAQTLRLI